MKIPISCFFALSALSTSALFPIAPGAAQIAPQNVSPALDLRPAETSAFKLNGAIEGAATLEEIEVLGQDFKRALRARAEKKPRLFLSKIAASSRNRPRPRSQPTKNGRKSSCRFRRRALMPKAARNSVFSSATDRKPSRSPSSHFKTSAKPKSALCHAPILKSPDRNCRSTKSKAASSF